MTGDGFSDELLMRFVDGEVDLATAERIEAAKRDDADLASRIEVFVRTRALARGALEPLLNEPVPGALLSSVETMIERHRERGASAGGEVVAMRPRPQPSRPVRHWAVPLAASIAAVLAGLGGFWLGVQNGTQPQSLSLGTVGNPGLSDALRSLASGDEKQIAGLGRLRALSSFEDRNGVLCRELELDPTAGKQALAFVACREEGTWTTTFAAARPGDDDGYAPASSMEALDAYLAAIEASPPLTAAEEKKALESAE